jgi:hypothetical protein
MKSAEKCWQMNSLQPIKLWDHPRFRDNFLATSSNRTSSKLGSIEITIFKTFGSSLKTLAHLLQKSKRVACWHTKIINSVIWKQTIIIFPYMFEKKQEDSRFF